MCRQPHDRSYNKFDPFCCYITNEMIGTQLKARQSIWVVYNDRLLRQRFIGELYPRLLNSSANPKLDPNPARSMTLTWIIALNWVFKSIQTCPGTLIIAANVFSRSGTMLCVIDLARTELEWNLCVEQRVGKRQYIASEESTSKLSTTN